MRDRWGVEQWKMMVVLLMSDGALAVTIMLDPSLKIFIKKALFAIKKWTYFIIFNTGTNISPKRFGTKLSLTINKPVEEIALIFFFFPPITCLH